MMVVNDVDAEVSLAFRNADPNVLVTWLGVGDETIFLEAKDTSGARAVALDLQRTA